MVADLLKARLMVVDRRCEDETREKIDKFYAEARYEGGRFRTPSFQEVANTVLQSISKKEREFVAEIGRVMGTIQGPLDDAAFDETQRSVAGLLDGNRYSRRLSVFVEGIKRKAASYGVPFDPAHHRIDLAFALYEAGMHNLLHQARASVVAELALYRRERNEKPQGWRGTLLAIVELLELKPNFAGFGLNLNRLLKDTLCLSRGPRGGLKTNPARGGRKFR